MRSPSHPALRCGIQEYRQRSSRAPTRDPENTGKFTRKILFPGPSIAVRGDTVLDAVSRIYPLFIPKENRRQYRPGHWGARPPLFFSRKRKGKIKRKLPADVRKLKNDCEARGKRTRRARFAAAVRHIGRSGFALRSYRTLMRHPEIPVVYAKRKLPADVRKLKNGCEVRGKRTRRARFAAAVRQALLPRALRLIRPGSNIFKHLFPSFVPLRHFSFRFLP